MGLIGIKVEADNLEELEKLIATKIAANKHILNYSIEFSNNSSES